TGSTSPCSTVSGISGRCVSLPRLRSNVAAAVCDRLAQLVNRIGFAQDRKIATRIGGGVAVTGRQQDRQVGTNFLQPLCEAQAIDLAGHDDVGEDQVDSVEL